MKCLGIGQNRKRFKVMIDGKYEKGSQNKVFPKKISSCKIISVNLVSEKHGIRGNADEVHILVDGTCTFRLQIRHMMKGSLKHIKSVGHVCLND